MRGAVFSGLLLAGLWLAPPGLAQTTTPGVAPALSQAPAALPEADLRELVDAAKASAAATRESVGYARVTPDILIQILAKLDKLENKLDKIENALKVAPRRSARP
jgi:hypothetical protein